VESQPSPTSNSGTETAQSLDSSFSNPVSNDLDLPIAVRKGVRSYTLHPLTDHLSYHCFSQNHKSFLTSLDSIVIPKSIEEALKDQNWKQVMQEEMNALNKNQT